MATAVLGSRVRKGSARPFIGLGEGEGELGREQPGQDAKRGENADSARRSAMAMAWRAGVRVAAVQRQESWFGASLGAASVVWAWGSAPVRPGGRCRRRRTASPVDEVQGDGGGRRWQWQFCNFLEVQNPVM